MVIYPEIRVTPDLPTIIFRQARDKVDLEVELPRILQAQGWGCGTYFHVQFVNHEKTELLASALYVVTKESESLHTSDNQYQPVTKTVINREAKLVGNWWPELFDGLSYLEGQDVKVVAAGEPSENVKPTVVWNPGRKKHQVKLNDKVIYESSDKEEAMKVASGQN